MRPTFNPKQYNNGFTFVLRMPNAPSKYLLFLLLSLIWGSSFILMKLGMNGLNAWQVASVRIITSGLVLLPLAIPAFRRVPRHLIGWVFLSGTLGSLLPAYLFCLAEQRIDSSLAGTLNALTPVFTIVTGALFFSVKTPRHKVVGVLVAFSGAVLLFLSRQSLQSSGNLAFSGFIFLATLSYGMNVNLVQVRLKNCTSLDIVSMALLMNAVPAMLVFGIVSDESNLIISPLLGKSLAYAGLLGIVGTSLANVLFYQLIKQAGSLFASLVTYGIPFVAMGWGLVDGELVTAGQAGCLLIILIGVYLTSRPGRASNAFK
jgi:drug/metabolite transporter (DMT)-like permease